MFNGTCRKWPSGMLWSMLKDPDHEVWSPGGPGSVFFFLLVVPLLHNKGNSQMFGLFSKYPKIPDNLLSVFLYYTNGY